MTNGEPKLPENLDAVPLTPNLRRILPALEAALDNLAKINQEGDPLIKGTTVSNRPRYFEGGSFHRFRRLVLFPLTLQ